MDAATALWTIALIWGAAALVPGPDFLAIARAAVGGSRRHGLACVLGVLCGTVIWGAAGAFGVSALFAAAPWLYLALKIGGGGYLIFVGLQLLRAGIRGAAGADAIAPLAERGLARAFAQGFAANLANPKTAIFVASIFATILPPTPAPELAAATVAVTTGVSCLWYTAAACFLSMPAVRRAYGRAKRVVTLAAGGLFVLFGTRLAVER